MHWRSLVVVEQGAEATVVEQYMSGADDLEAYFNPVTELIVGEGAKLEYLCVQDLSERSWILGTQRAQRRPRRVAALDRARLRLRPGQAADGDRHHTAAAPPRA